jgi:hypothetical protein
MVAHPQLKVQLSQQSFKPASTPTGFRPHYTKHDKCSLRTKISHASGGSFTDQTRNIVLAIVGVAAAVVVVVAVVAIHYSKKRAIAGCVSSAGSGMNVTDEKDKQTYALSGNTTGIKPGDRMKLQGKKVKSKGADKTLVWEAKAVAKDFGVCQP